MDYFNALYPKENNKKLEEKSNQGETQIKIKKYLHIDYADDLSILGVLSKTDKFLLVLIVQSAMINLKINFRKTKLLRLGINEVEEIMLGNNKIDHWDSFPYVGTTVIEVG